MSAIWVQIAATRGSAPRDAGTAMKVTATSTEGTIGGGALEHRAIAQARALLASGGGEERQTIPLGPGLGQCCGGAVTLHFTRTPCPVDETDTGTVAFDPSAPPLRLWLWGAGHVGRAMVAAAPATHCEITWIDDAEDRFPEEIPDHVTEIVAADMPLLAVRAAPGAHHLVFTYSHDIDLALCAALLKIDTAGIGLIGSATKWARFSRRLAAMGLDPLPITCPIGDKSKGKAPAEIARSTLAGLIGKTREKATA
jgi:xanthine dehydrogenase accessory factor